MICDDQKQVSGYWGKENWLEKGRRKRFGVMKGFCIFIEEVSTFIIKLQICTFYCMLITLNKFYFKQKL